MDEDITPNYDLKAWRNENDMAEKKMYVIHTKRGYWIGAFSFNKQLRFAKVYTSLRFVNEAVERIKRAYSDELFPKVLEVHFGLTQNEPTAEVVPKSEVERLTVELDAMRGAANSYKMHYENLAREIFEEIERITAATYNYFMFDRENVGINATIVTEFSDELDNEIAELKKKYTEDIKNV